MFPITNPEPRHPDEVAALKQLAAYFRHNGDLLQAWFEYYTTCEEHGTHLDPFTIEVGNHILALEGLARGRPDREKELKSVASGHLVPVLDLAGVPVMRDGEQMYTTHYNDLAARVAEMVGWLQRNNAADQVACIEHLRAADPDLPLDDVFFVVRQAGKLRRGEQ